MMLFPLMMCPRRAYSWLPHLPIVFWNTFHEYIAPIIRTAGTLSCWEIRSMSCSCTPRIPLRRLQAASDLGVGSLVTEFDISDDVPTMTATMDVMDAHLLSWIGWEYKGFAGTTSNGTCTGCGR